MLRRETQNLFGGDGQNPKHQVNKNLRMSPDPHRMATVVILEVTVEPFGLVPCFVALGLIVFEFDVLGAPPRIMVNQRDATNALDFSRMIGLQYAASARL